MDFVVTWFKGEERLWKPYWLGGVVGGFFWQILNVLVGFAGMPFLSTPLVVLSVIYWFWVLTAIWRCAFNVDSNVWGYLARVYVVIVVLGGAIAVVLTVTV